MSPAQMRRRLAENRRVLRIADQSQSTDLPPTAGTSPPSPAVTRRHETSTPPEAAPPPPETTPLPSRRRRGWSPAPT